MVLWQIIKLDYTATATRCDIGKSFWQVLSTDSTCKVWCKSVKWLRRSWKKNVFHFWRFCKWKFTVKVGAAYRNANRNSVFLRSFQDADKKNSLQSQVCSKQSASVVVSLLFTNLLNPLLTLQHVQVVTQDRMTQPSQQPKWYSYLRAV